MGLSPPLILTLRGPERVLVVSTEPPDDLFCLTTPGVGRPGDGAFARAVDRVHSDAPSAGGGLQDPPPPLPIPPPIGPPPSPSHPPSDPPPPPPPRRLRIEHHIDAFDCQQLATLAYAYARLHFPHKTLMSLLARRACEPDMAATFTPPAMALILRAFADMGLLNRSLLRVMGARLREPPVLRTVTPADVATLMAVAQAQGLAEAKAIISALGDLEKDTSPWTGGRATETGEDGARGWLLEEGGPATGAAPADRGVRRRRRVRRARSAKGPALRERLRAILRARIRERIRDSKPPP